VTLVQTLQARGHQLNSPGCLVAP